MREDLIGKFIRPDAPAPPEQAKGRGHDVLRGGGAGNDYAPRPFMIDLLPVGGSRHAFPYAQLLRVHYEPGAGIELFFATHNVTIRGRSLDPLYEGIIAQAVGQVVAVGERHDPGNDEHGGPLVHAIVVCKSSGGDAAASAASEPR